MMLTRIMSTAVGELRANLSRSLLTAGCIAIAIAAFTIVIQLGESARQGVADTVERTQGREGTIRLSTSGGPAPILLNTATQTLDRATRAGAINAGGRLTPLADRKFSLGAESGDNLLRAEQQVTIALVAVDPGVTEVAPVTLESGRWLSKEDSSSFGLSVVLSNDAARQMAVAGRVDKSELLNRTLVIRSPLETHLRIVGIVDDGPLIRYMSSPAVAFVALQPGGLNPAIASASEISSVDSFGLAVGPAEDSRKYLEASEKDALLSLGHPTAQVSAVRVDTADDFAAASRALALLLAGIGGIALLVGVLGIINVSLMSVRERTKEFGLRRALGTPSTTIAGLVLTESALIVGLGGVLGVSVAWVLSATSGARLTQYIGVPVEPISLRSALIGIGVTTVCGLMCGLIPARRARKLGVLEAIRL